MPHTFNFGCRAGTTKHISQFIPQENFILPINNSDYLIANIHRYNVTTFIR